MHRSLNEKNLDEGGAGGKMDPKQGEDYENLSNEELTRLLYEKHPDMREFRVMDDTRNTTIAMLKTFQGR